MTKQTSAIERQLKDMEILAKAWRDFSRESNGWSPKTYEGGTSGERVWCYFADNSNHTAVNFGVENGELRVQLFRPVKFDGTVRVFASLDKMHMDYSKLLAEKQRAWEKVSEERKAAQKAEEIENLERKLAEAKGGER